MDSSLDVRQLCDGDAEAIAGVLHAAGAELGASLEQSMPPSSEPEELTSEVHVTRCAWGEQVARCAWGEQSSTNHWSGKTYDSVVMIRPLGPKNAE